MSSEPRAPRHRCWRDSGGLVRNCGHRIVGRDIFQEGRGRYEEQVAGLGDAEIEQAIVVAGRLTDEHVVEHLLDGSRRTRVTDEIGAEFLFGDAAERHVVAHDLDFLAVHHDLGERVVGIGRHLDSSFVNLAHVEILNPYVLALDNAVVGGVGIPEPSGATLVVSRDALRTWPCMDEKWADTMKATLLTNGTGLVASAVLSLLCLAGVCRGQGTYPSALIARNLSRPGRGLPLTRTPNQACCSRCLAPKSAWC